MFWLVDKTVTPIGHRMMRRWLAAPLMNETKIRQRLDAVEELMKNFEFVSTFRQKAKTLPDIERLLAKLYKQSKQRTRSMFFVQRSRLETQFILMLPPSTSWTTFLPCSAASCVSLKL